MMLTKQGYDSMAAVLQVALDSGYRHHDAVAISAVPVLRFRETDYSMLPGPMRSTGNSGADQSIRRLLRDPDYRLRMEQAYTDMLD